MHLLQILLVRRLLTVEVGDATTESSSWNVRRVSILNCICGLPVHVCCWFENIANFGQGVGRWGGTFIFASFFDPEAEAVDA